MPDFFTRHGTLLFALLGSIVRIGYGCLFEPWESAPDHMAWEWILAQRNFHYDHLIYYPHEGGTIVISLLAHFFKLFTSFSSLTIVAALLDFVIRFLQIRIVGKLFQGKVVLFFSIWTVIAAPILIPWGTVNFGLHAIASIFPFLLLYYISLPRDSSKYYLGAGLLLGFAVWFSYSNLVLIPAYFGYLLFSRRGIRQWGYTLLGLGMVLLPHILIRLFADAGFHLTPFGLMSIRGEGFALSPTDIVNRLPDLPSALANALGALPQTPKHIGGIRLFFFGLAIIAGAGIYRAFRRKSIPHPFGLALLIFAGFAASYLLSPFFYIGDQGTYVSFRHLAYILPLLALLLIWGISQIPFRQILFVLWGLVALSRSVSLFMLPATPPDAQIYRVIGWALAQKLGHHPPKVQAIMAQHPEHRALISQGVGWGMSSACFQQRAVDDPNLPAQLKTFADLFFAYPESAFPDLMTGVEFSFQPGITPILDPAIQPMIAEAILRR